MKILGGVFTRDEKTGESFRMTNSHDILKRTELKVMRFTSQLMLEIRS